jgi:geranylgeranyl diphosphate synthase type II
MNDFEARSAAYKEHIESYLAESFSKYNGHPQQQLFSSMKYSLLAGGKRLRPVFVFDFCRMCCNNWKIATPFAAAVEMIHTYSLIHDDLPCMDNDDFRRGAPTNHRVFGDAIAVLAGDALLTTAFTQLSMAELDSDSRIMAVNVLSRCAGELGMVGGQVLDIMSETRQCTEQEVLDIQSRKTGALIRAACLLGVIAGKGSSQQMDAAGVFADHLGLAFQIRDDMLDVIGSIEDLGKATGTDGVKNTFVRLYGLDKCRELVDHHTNIAVQSLEKFDDSNFMRALALNLTSRIS